MRKVISFLVLIFVLASSISSSSGSSNPVYNKSWPGINVGGVLLDSSQVVMAHCRHGGAFDLDDGLMCEPVDSSLHSANYAEEYWCNVPDNQQVPAKLIYNGIATNEIFFYSCNDGKITDADLLEQMVNVHPENAALLNAAIDTSLRNGGDGQVYVSLGGVAKTDGSYLSPVKYCAADNNTIDIDFGSVSVDDLSEANKVETLKITCHDSLDGAYNLPINFEFTGGTVDVSANTTSAKLDLGQGVTANLVMDYLSNIESTMNATPISNNINVTLEAGSSPQPGLHSASIPLVISWQ